MRLKNEFSKLKRKIILQITLILLLTIIVGYFIYFALIDGVLQAPFANMFINFCEKVLQLDFYTAQNIYSSIFQLNKPLWLAIGFILLLLVIFYLALSRFTRYFNKISEGVDRLTEESEAEIQLPAELDFMEKKLNTVKSKLEKRAMDAKEAEQRKNDLVVYLAHDIKTPLTSVIGYLSLLDEASDMPMEQKEKYLKITLEKATRLEHLINEFFDITRFNLQSILLEKETINLNYMLMQMADEFYPLLAPNGKQAIVEVEEDLKIDADANKLARVFNNILKNAIAYSYENSIIEISGTRKNEQAIITFTNKGKIIPPQKLDMIFEKFYRLDTSRATQTGGAGLGLAIAKEIVHAHGGSISAESIDEKTVFTVTIPIHS
ncbi:vancomycin resistance histidine kinase VanS [Cytobacillus solani]|uniref:vancomycin resistance histidine kinase VanS n=1 Tax=Cytobacillus solani TaxID=1637975 RepID=UPI001E4A0321|nr:vancomycin resistance histidine kinase VanS [Cytobacillus solani]USK57588.1 HAMP domain-containing histidine kinase [Cytobacillus solani]